MEFRFVISAIELLGKDYNFFENFHHVNKLCDPEVSISTELSLGYNKLHIF